jgi:hypothetical protein
MYHARKGHDSGGKESGDRGARADADVSVDDGTAGVVTAEPARTPKVAAVPSTD